MRISRKLVAALLVGAVSLQAKAELLLDQVPANALGFFAWQGSMGPGYDGSSFQQLVTATNFWERLTQIKNGPKAEDIAIGQIYFGASSVIYLQKIDSDQNKNQAVIVSKIGPMAQTAVTKINAEKKPNVNARQQGDLLIIELGEGASHSLSGGGILEQPAFKSAAAQVDAHAAAMVYVDCDKTLRAIDTIVTTTRGANERRGWAMFSDVLGFDGFKQLIWSGSFVDKAWQTQTFIAMGPNRAGLPAFLDNKPLSSAAMVIAPTQAAWRGVVRFDASRFINDIRDGVSRVEPNAAQQMDAGLEMGKQTMGFDIEKDLAASLGDEWVYFNTATDTQLRQNMVIINTLRNPEGAAKALQAASNFMGAQMSRRGGAKGFETRTVDGLEINVLTLPNASPTWAIEEGKLLFALDPNAISAARKQIAANGESPKKDETVALMAKGAHGPITSFSYFDLPRLAPMAYANIKEAMAKKLSPEEINLLPPLDKILPTLTPANSVAWQDETGWHSIGKEPFPFSTMIIDGVLMRLQPEASTQPGK